MITKQVMLYFHNNQKVLYKKLKRMIKMKKKIKKNLKYKIKKKKNLKKKKLQMSQKMQMNKMKLCQQNKIRNNRLLKKMPEIFSIMSQKKK